MRNHIVAAVLAPACLLLTAAAPAQDGLEPLVEKVIEMFKEKGLQPTGFSNSGQLAQGAEKRVSVTLKSGEIVVGLCDGDCGDLNLRLANDNGTVDEDVKDDDFPIVAAENSGSYTLTVTMKACKNSPCTYRLTGFSK